MQGKVPHGLAETLKAFFDEIRFDEYNDTNNHISQWRN